jgi:antitoxin (DNA-binding transcriptional repressor) of toxin-antitoxin stability system
MSGSTAAASRVIGQIDSAGPGFFAALMVQVFPDYYIGETRMASSDADEVSIGVNAFKARCLALIDDGARGIARRVLLTKHNRPVAAIVPVDASPAPLSGGHSAAQSRFRPAPI